MKLIDETRAFQDEDDCLSYLETTALARGHSLHDLRLSPDQQGQPQEYD